MPVTRLTRCRVRMLLYPFHMPTLGLEFARQKKKFFIAK
ncbi:Uncharacterised protein [Enterobacter cloacae]|nr:Uncharacterised protein [Enterobacter cloacae]